MNRFETDTEPDLMLTQGGPAHALMRRLRLIQPEASTGTKRTALILVGNHLGSALPVLAARGSRLWRRYYTLLSRHFRACPVPLRAADPDTGGHPDRCSIEASRTSLRYGGTSQ